MDTKSEEALAVLREGRERVAAEGGWTQGEYARDAQGAAMSASSGRPVCFCAVGGLFGARQGDYASEAELAGVMDLHAALPDDFGGVVTDWNDAPGRTQADVLALYDRAIAAVEARIAAGVA